MAKKIVTSLGESTFATSKSLNNMPKMASTIDPQKLDQSRFSQIQKLENGSSSLRIIIFAVSIILVGVILVLLVVRGTANNPTENTDNPLSTPVVTETNNSYIISKTSKADSTVTNLSTKEDYIDSISLSGGDASLDLSNVSLSKIYYTSYQTFSRLIFDLTSLTGKLPAFKVDFDSLKNQLAVTFPGVSIIDTDLKKDVAVNDLVEEIRFDAVNSRHLIFLAEDVRYRAFVDGTDLIVDIKTVDELENNVVVPTTTPTVTATPVPTPTEEETVVSDDDTERPAAPHLTNEFSQNTQYISSSVTTNTVPTTSFAVEDTGPYFEIDLVAKGLVGESYVPNVKAYLTAQNGKNYLKVEIENTEVTFFNNSASPYFQNISKEKIETNIGVNMSGANFINMRLVSFESGKAIYEIEIKNKADFKILSSKIDISGQQSEAIAIQIKD